MESLKIKISRDFSISPGPRYIKEGKFSGEDFRKSTLSPKFSEAIRLGKKLIIDLDGTAGYGTSFLEEAFGGLIREEHFAMNQINSVIELISEEEPYLVEDINEYIEKAALELVS